VVDVGNDGEISDVIHACCDVFLRAPRRSYNGEAVAVEALNREAM
jgi:hypothetical protein